MEDEFFGAEVERQTQSPTVVHRNLMNQSTNEIFVSFTQFLAYIPITYEKIAKFHTVHDIRDLIFPYCIHIMPHAAYTCVLAVSRRSSLCRVMAARYNNHIVHAT